MIFGSPSAGTCSAQTKSPVASHARRKLSIIAWRDFRIAVSPAIRQRLRLRRGDLRRDWRRRRLAARQHSNAHDH